MRLRDLDVDVDRHDLVVCRAGHAVASGRWTGVAVVDRAGELLPDVWLEIEAAVAHDEAVALGASDETARDAEGVDVDPASVDVTLIDSMLALTPTEPARGLDARNLRRTGKTGWPKLNLSDLMRPYPAFVQVLGNLPFDEDRSFEAQFAEFELDLKEDILQVQFPAAIAVDLGWYPSFDPEGAFTAVVAVCDDEDNPFKVVSSITFREPRELRQVLDGLLAEADQLSRRRSAG